MTGGLWQRSIKALRAWLTSWMSDTPPPDEAAVRRQAGKAAKERLREHASRAIAQADAAYSDLGREVARHHELIEGAQALINSDENGARQILSRLIDAEIRIQRLANRYRLFQQEAERQAATWLVVRDEEELGAVVGLEQMSVPSETELLVNSGTDRGMFEAGVLTALAQIAPEIRHSQIETAIGHLKSSEADLSGFTVTEALDLAEIVALASEPRFRGIALKD